MFHLGSGEQIINLDKNNNKESLINVSILNQVKKIPTIELFVSDSKNPNNEKKYIITNEGQITNQLSLNKADITFIGAETEQVNIIVES